MNLMCHNWRVLPSERMKKSEQSIKSKIAEHEKFLRQCKVRIRPSLTLTALLTIVLGWVGLRLNDGWKVAIPVLTFCYFYTAMEITSYFRHNKAIKNLIESEKAAPNREDTPA